MNFDASAYVNVGVWEPVEDDDDEVLTVSKVTCNSFPIKLDCF